MRITYFILGIFLIHGLLKPLEGQNVQRVIHKNQFEQYLDSLHRKFNINKDIPEQYELQCLIALSYFPELKDDHIVFLPKKIRTTMATRPHADAIFYQKEKRTYQIFINNLIENKDGINFDDVPFNAQIGLIGHELGHVADYKQKNMIRILANGIAYVLSSSYRKAFEANVDNITIEHGLGWQLHAFADFVFNDARISKSYQSFKESNYPSPQRYEEWLKEYPGLYEEKSIEKTFDD